MAASCTVKDVGVSAIEAMVEKKRGAFDYLIIETTGLANPGPIIGAFWLDEGLQSCLQLDAVVTLVDCLNADRNRRSGSATELEWSAQVALADVVLLNKTDLVTDESVESLRVAIEQINPTVSIHKTIKSRIPLDLIFNQNCYSSEDSIPAFRQDIDHSHQSVSSSVITSVSLSPESKTVDDIDIFENKFTELLWNSDTSTQTTYSTDSMDVLRAKGSVVTTCGRVFQLQAVGELYELTEMNKESVHITKTHLVFIGKNLSRQKIEDCLFGS